MSAIRSKHTKPEMVVRSLVHRMGFRYRLHVKMLPGTPDLVFPSRRKIIEVRGCFWHMHTCGRCHIPATRHAWWKAKLLRNVERDAAAAKALRSDGWRVLVVWECQTHSRTSLSKKLGRFLQHGNGWQQGSTTTRS